MADDSQTRKLATIVALDVAGYSARTEADEARTTEVVPYDFRAECEKYRDYPKDKFFR